MRDTGRIRAILAVSAALVAGLWLGGHPDWLPTPVREAFVSEPQSVVEQARELIQGNFFEEVSPRTLENKAIEGMVESLDDRFSHYFAPKTFSEFKQATGGEFSGVGLTVNKVKRGLRVASVFDGSPAKKEGIRAGDVITDVNGKSIADVSANVATTRIKGEPGTTVRLRILRPSTGKQRTLKVERATIDVPAVEGKIRNSGETKLAHVVLSGFTKGAHGELRDEVKRLYDDGAEGLVLDMRGNGGGLLTEAVLVSSIFVEKGVIVTTAGRERPREVYRATGKALPRKPMVVLVNGDTASAAEIVAGALREHGVATIVGVKTFGKGTFQQLIELPNGGGLDLTVGEYLPAGGRAINGRGLKPSVKVEDDPKTERDEALRRALEVVVREAGDGR